MTAYAYAKSLGLDTAIYPGSDPPRGYTSAEIVAALKALPRHYKNVFITGGPADTESVNLLHLLTARHRVMGMGSAQQWIGPLIDLEVGNPQVAMIMSILRPMLQVNDTLVYCADSDDAANMLNALESVVAALTGKPAQVAAEVAMLSGGRIGAEFTDLTVEEYELQRDVALQAIADAEAAESARIAAEAAEELRQSQITTRMRALAETYDAGQRAIVADSTISQENLLAVVTTKLAEEWV